MTSKFPNGTVPIDAATTIARRLEYRLDQPKGTVWMDVPIGARMYALGGLGFVECPIGRAVERAGVVKRRQNLLRYVVYTKSIFD